jgi:hypothetical protein
MFTYTLQTPDHGYDFIPDPLDVNVVRVKSEFKDSIEEFINTLELAGFSEAQDHSSKGSNLERMNDLEKSIEEADNDYDHYYFIDIQKADLALFLQFEVLNYMGASFGN